jgi:hypothetical protein
LSEREFSRQVRITFVKVAETQHRGATHFHGLLRADVATWDGSTAPPPPWVTASLVADAFSSAAAAVVIPGPHPSDPAGPA